MRKKPINKCCSFSSIDETASQTEQNDIISLQGRESAEQLNMQIPAGLKSLGGCMMAMENELASAKCTKTQVGALTTSSVIQL